MMQEIEVSVLKTPAEQAARLRLVRETWAGGERRQQFDSRFELSGPVQGDCQMIADFRIVRQFEIRLAE